MNNNFEFDAIFLPGNIHGCEWQVYILYHNYDSISGGSWEIGVIDKDTILRLYKETFGDHEMFFDCLAGAWDCDWYYCDIGSDQYDEYTKSYYDADFIVGKDGDQYDEMMFLVDWAMNQDN